jgi:filamentous hemagglutinin
MAFNSISYAGDAIGLRDAVRMDEISTNIANGNWVRTGLGAVADSMLVGSLGSMFRGGLDKAVEIDPRKFDYLFGHVSSNAHNTARSNQLALEMKRLGVPDTAVGRQILSEHLALSVKAEGNVIRTYSNQYGKFEVRESLFIGPSGQAAKFESTFKILEGGTRQFITAIPFNTKR